MEFTPFLILEGFAIGVSVFMIISMIYCYIRFVNFFSLILPYLIADIIFLIYFLKKNKEWKKKVLKPPINLKQKIINFITKNKQNFFILIITFFLHFLLHFYLLDLYLSIPGTDSYYWFREMLFLSNYGYLSSNFSSNYTPGFTIFNSTIYLFFNDYFSA
ncbi:MAG: hypothetical protein ACTSPW_08115, partial [Promethearchaeota archaeon]